MASALCLAVEIEPARAAEPDAKGGASDVSHLIFRVIVTRHGVRSISSTPQKYEWPSWDPVPASFLTKRGYDLIKSMGAFYGGFYPDGASAACKDGGLFVYADKDQRTLYTAQAMVEGLCGAPNAVPIYHEPDLSAEDPVFNAAARLAQNGRADTAQSKRAVMEAAGEPPSSVLLTHADDLSKLQELLDRRCGARCPPVAYGPSVVVQQGLAELKGPLTTASTYAEDIFLEYAQCRPAEAMAPGLDKDTLRTDLEAAMRLHVLAYDVNARNAYNPLVRGGTLFAHIVAMLDKKIGRVAGNIVVPDEIDQQTELVILSGHDTQLGALGGVLQAHWKPKDPSGIVQDDMPPGSALLFELVRTPSGKVRVGLRFASMTLDQFRAGEGIAAGVETTPVTFVGCAIPECTVPIEQFESLAQSLEDRGFVDEAWTTPSKRPVDLAPLADDPSWTQCRASDR